MKHRKIVLIILAIVCAASLMTFLFKDSTDLLKTALGIVSGMTSLITMVIALTLYSKYGIEKSLVDKQKDTVIELLLQIAKLNFYVRGDKFFFIYKPLTTPVKMIEEFYQHPISVNLAYFEYLSPISDLSDNIFLPKSVSRKIKILFPNTLTSSDKKTDLEYSMILTSITSNGEMPSTDMFNVFEDKTITLMEYTTYWTDIIKECKSWIDKNSNSSLELNLE